MYSNKANFSGPSRCSTQAAHAFPAGNSWNFTQSSMCCSHACLSIIWQTVNRRRPTLPELLLDTLPEILQRRISESREPLPKELPIWSEDQAFVEKFVTRADVIVVAERLVADMQVVLSTVEDCNNHHYLLGPEAAKSKFRAPRNRNKLDLLLREPSSSHSNATSSHSSDESPTHSHRYMITLPRGQVRRMYKFLSGFPLPTEPFPADFALIELCRKYPDHFLGDNLILFIQAGWTASKITSFLPDQSDVHEAERVTIAAISARLTRLRNTLKLKGERQALMQAEREHAEGCHRRD